MKESIYYEPLATQATEQTSQPFALLQKGLLLGWGSIGTYVIMIFATVDPYRFDMVGNFARGAMLLWMILLFAPAFCATLVWQWPSYQQIPLIEKRNVILQGLALSWVTYLSFVLFRLAWNLYDKEFNGIISFLGLGLGLGLLFIAKRLYRSDPDLEELFP